METNDLPSFAYAFPWFSMFFPIAPTIHWTQASLLIMFILLIILISKHKHWQINATIERTQPPSHDRPHLAHRYGFDDQDRDNFEWELETALEMCGELSFLNFSPRTPSPFAVTLSPTRSPQAMSQNFWTHFGCSRSQPPVLLVQK